MKSTACNFVYRNNQATKINVYFSSILLILHTMTFFRRMVHGFTLFICHEQQPCRSSAFDGICRLNKKCIFSSASPAKRRSLSNAKDCDSIKNSNNTYSSPIDPSDMTQVYYIPTIRVPGTSVHTLLQNSRFRDFMPTERFQDVHPRIKMVRDDNSNGHSHVTGTANDVKLVLLEPDKVLYKHTNTTKTDASTFTFSGLAPELLSILTTYKASPGPILTLSINATQLPTAQFLSLVLPTQALPPPTSFEVIGHLMHLNLRAAHLPFKTIIGTALLQKFSPTITTIVNKVGELGGAYRTYEMELLAGASNYYVNVIENGMSLQFDVRDVYWSSRLAGERARMIREEIRDNEVVADAFCGVGALCIAAAKTRGCTVRANDLNPYAADCCKKNALRNGIKRVGDKQIGGFSVFCEDARDFIRSLGNRRHWEGDDTEVGKENGITGTNISRRRKMKVHSKKLQLKQRLSSPEIELPHHLVMNYPLGAPDFLDQLRWWPTNSKVETKVHLYTFARDDASTGRNAETVAIDSVAQSLLPQGGAIEITFNRCQELDALGCEVKVREIRDVAPGKVVLCVAFKATRLLIKRMQRGY